MGISRRAWSWIGLAVVAVAVALDYWFEPKWIGIDFHTYLAAATVGSRLGWSHIYDQALVTVVERQLVPSQYAQPFLSPPTVAWLVAPLTVFPYWVAFGIWAGFVFVAFAAALAWSGVSTGISRWIAVIGALAPWWVLHAVNLGQVVPLVAAGVVVPWRLLREKREVAAGLALALVLLKPNTALLVPLALLVAGRYRVFLAWCGAGAAIAAVAVATLGPGGVSAYIGQLVGPLPPGADALTLHGALGVAGLAATALRVVILVAVLAAAYGLRRSPGLVIAAGALGSLLMTPYLHGSDLCVLGAAAWIVWEERPQLAWRVPLAAAWLLASPYLSLSGLGPSLNRWPLLELALLGALVVTGWRAGRTRRVPLTGQAEARTRAPA